MKASASRRREAARRIGVQAANKASIRAGSTSSIRGRLPGRFAVLVHHHRAHALSEIRMRHGRAGQREFRIQRLLQRQVAAAPQRTQRPVQRGWRDLPQRLQRRLRPIRRPSASSRADDFGTVAAEKQWSIAARCAASENAGSGLVECGQRGDAILGQCGGQIR